MSMYNPQEKVKHQVNASKRTVTVTIDLDQILTEGIAVAPLSKGGEGSTHIIARNEGWVNFEVNGQPFALSVCVTAKKPKAEKPKKMSQADQFALLQAQHAKAMEAIALLTSQLNTKK